MVDTGRLELEHVMRLRRNDSRIPWRLGDRTGKPHPKDMRSVPNTVRLETCGQVRPICKGPSSFFGSNLPRPV